MKKLKKFLLSICIILGCTSCDTVLDSLNVTNGDKFIVSSVEQQGEVYFYHLNKEGHKKIIWDEYGYTSANRYNVGDTLIVKIELYKE